MTEGVGRWLRATCVDATGLWVLDQRLFHDFGEPVSHVLGMIPETVLDLLVESEVDVPDGLLRIGPGRDVPAENIAKEAEPFLVTFDGRPSLGVSWRHDGHLLFGTLWEGRLVCGIRPEPDESHARLTDC